jgi:hypothetical protein
LDLIGFNPVDWAESASNGKLEREAVNAAFSAAASAQITLCWSLGRKKWLGFLGDVATAAYLSLQQLEGKGFLTLTVPKDLLNADNLARFQTEYKSE